LKQTRVDVYDIPYFLEQKPGLKYKPGLEYRPGSDVIVLIEAGP